MENVITNNALPQNKRKKSIRLGRIFIYLTLIIYSLFLMVPFYTIVISAFTDHAELDSALKFIWLPETFSLQGFKNLIEFDVMYYEVGIPSMAVGFINTLWITCLPTFVGLFVSGLAAYVYAKIKLPGKNVFFAIEMATMMLPLGSMQVVSHLFYNSILGWNDTPLPLIIPGMFGSASLIFFLRTYFEGINNEILEAARIDGKSVFGIYFSIMIPLAIPAFVAQFIFGFVGGYNDYVGPMLYLTGNKMMVTLQLAVANLQNSFSKYPETICASAVVSMIPLIIIYCLAQKLFINGIAVGGGKE